MLIDTGARLGMAGLGGAWFGKAWIFLTENKVGTLETIGDVTNDAKSVIDASLPYRALVSVQGTSDILFHRWSCDAVEAKSKAAKNSKAKKEDDVESYVYRDDDGNIAIPGEYLRQAAVYAAKFRQDPRSPRKSAFDLYKAGVVSLTNLASLGSKQWDYLDRRRVCIQRNGVTRTRPGMLKGWKAEFELMVLTPEYIDPMTLRDVIEQAGRLIGMADFRPTFGRFGIVGFEVQAG